MRSVLLAGALVALAAAPARAAATVSTPPPSSPLAHHGFVTDAATAERAIAFRPFVPHDPIDAVALEPPFHGAGVSANEGIAYAYRREARTWILSEWPASGGSITAFAQLSGVAESGCALRVVGGTAHPRGVVWRTPRGLVMSLLPDGSADRRIIVAEWRRLVRSGAC
jgi:hypothetical protein